MFVSISVMQLFQVQNVKITGDLRFNIMNNYIVLTLTGFFFYYFLPSDTVRDYPAYAEFYIFRAMNLYSDDYAYFSTRDLLFFNYVEVLSSIGIDYRYAYGALVALYTYALVKLASKSNVLPWMVLFLALVFGNLYFVVSGLRQATAMAFVLLAFNAYLDKRWLLTAVFVAIAAGFHGSALMGVMLIGLCVFISRRTSLLNILSWASLLTFPLLWWQWQGFSVINLVMPYLSFLITDDYLRYTDAIQAFDSGQDTVGLGFAFFTLSKIFFIALILWLNKKRVFSKNEQLLVFIGLFYIFCFNVMGFNEFTHRLLNYLTPFLFIGMSLILTKASSRNSLARLLSCVFLVTAGLLAVIVALR